VHDLIPELVNQTAIAVFSITGVLAAIRKDRDIFGLVVLGTITAVGGGTIRDTILKTDIFWIADFTSIITAVGTAIVTFAVLKLRRINRDTYRLLLYLDALGMAFFCIQAFDKTINLNFSFPVAVIMAMLTGLGGGVIRDVLTGRPNLLITTELYASPALLGCFLYALLREFLPGFSWSGLIAIIFIFGFRSLAIYFNLHMPSWLVNKRDSEHEYSPGHRPSRRSRKQLTD